MSILCCFFFFKHHEDPAIGVHVIDRYTYYVLQFLEGVKPNSKATVGELVSHFFTIYFGVFHMYSFSGKEEFSFPVSFLLPLHK